MKTNRILSLLYLYDALPRGLNVCDGDIFANSINRDSQYFISMKGTFMPDVTYLEIYQKAISPLLWDRFGNCDAEVEYTFGTYRYLVVE